MTPESASSEALDLLRRLSRPTAHGYVTLNAVPYRGHHLLLTEVLRTTAPGDEVFEGGVSSGYFAEAVVAAGRVVDGHELDAAAAADAARICRRVWQGDLQSFDPGDLADDYAALVFGDTLEHVPDPLAVLKRLRGHLRPGGHLVMSLPNVANIGVRLQLLAGRFRYADRGILDRTHLRFFTVATMRELVGDAGFEIERLQAAVPVPGIDNETICKLVWRAGNLRPGLFGYNVVVTARRPA